MLFNTKPSIDSKCDGNRRGGWSRCEPHTASLYPVCLGEGEVWMRYSQRSRVPKLEMHRVGTVQAKSWWGGGGIFALAESAYQRTGTTSQWLLSCLYYAKTCILEGAWLGVESHTRTEILAGPTKRYRLPGQDDMQRCICIHLFE